MKNPKPDFRSWLELLSPQRVPCPESAASRGECLCMHAAPFITAPNTGGVRWCGHVMASRTRLADFLGVNELARALGNALDAPVAPIRAPMPQAKELPPEIGRLGPFSLPGMPLENYFTSFVVAAPAGDGDVNLSIHRAQVRDDGCLTLRVVRRHLHALLEKNGQKMPAALLAGVDPAVFLAAALSLPEPGGELSVAGALQGAPVETAEIGGIRVPASFEACILGEFTGESAPEGPFIDLTGTLDPVRIQPVFRVDRIFVRPDPIIPMILPSSPEHALLMGLPREAGILRALLPLYDGVPRVRLTPGGAGWLHAVAAGASDASADEIGHAVFSAHPSCKRLVLVDGDIDPDRPHDVEWALATRFQAGRDLRILPGERGSTLDPSSRDGITDRWVLDARIPPGSDPRLFERILKG